VKFAVIVFPGSNCDHDAYYATKHVLGQQCEFVWHKDTSVGSADVVILPGGFSYGDYLRTGAIARFSPIMTAVREFADAGRPVIGICNGFQILQESGLLPGAMLRNRDVQFHCEHVVLRVEHTDTPFTRSATVGQVMRVPIAHGEGNFYAAPDVVAELEAKDRVIFRYVTPDGEVTDAANPNGSINSIAGICNEARNVVGLMPHPERAVELVTGSADGRTIFESVMQHAV
jgi:phosphoribosylformylglycinamidine synthase I